MKKTDTRTDRREFLQRWVGLGGLGLGAGAAFSGIRARTASAGERKVKAWGVVDPLIGERGRKDVDGYVGRTTDHGENGKTRTGVPTSCLQCVAICGIVGYVEGGRIVKIDGNPHVPNNRGMVCAKAQAGLNQVYDPDRLLYPLVRVGKRGEGKWKRVTMKEALDLVAFGGEIAGRRVVGLKEIFESGRGEEFMFHYGRSRIKGAVNHFCKDGMGSKTIGNHTSICETGKWLGQELTIGKHYDINDVANSRYILVFGANVMEAHTSHSYFAQRMVEGRMNGAKILTFDVRLSNTAAFSDEWVPIRPGTDLAIILAMTHVVLHERPYGHALYDETFIRRWTTATLEELRAHYEPYTPEWAERESGVPAKKVRRIAHEYGSTKPATIVTYRGFVGHYNGAYAEFAAKALEAITGNLMIKGGTHMKVSGKWEDAYGAVNKQYPDAVRKTKGLDVIDGDGIVLPTHHVSQWIFERIASGRGGRPKLYMTYCWNGAYTCGDNARTMEILADEEAMPFIVAVDTAMSETTEMADVVLPDGCFLERWTAEAPQSFALTPFLQIRQPVVEPLGECTDMQDIFIQLARRIGGNISKLHPYDSARDYVKACLDKTVAKAKASGKTLLGVDGKPIEGDPWEYLLKYGVIQQGTKPGYLAHEKRLTEKDLEGAIVDEDTGALWSPVKAHVSVEEAKKKGYRKVKNAYKAYAGQMVEGVAYKGFKPDKFNKSGLVEIKSLFLASAAEAVWKDIAGVVREEEEAFLWDHLASGLPCWVPVPEHRMREPGQLTLTSFKVNVQIHSRSQNCKWLQEIYHKNPLWIHPETARRVLGKDIREGDLVRVEQTMPEIAGIPGARTKVKSVTARVHLTEGVHPEVVCLSFHCGHWAYGRYASGLALDQSITGAEPDGETIWWQEGVSKEKLDLPTEWNDLRGVHANWIIPNMPARVSGQFRSNDTLVTLHTT